MMPHQFSCYVKVSKLDQPMADESLTCLIKGGQPVYDPDYYRNHTK